MAPGRLIAFGGISVRRQQLAIRFHVNLENASIMLDMLFLHLPGFGFGVHLYICFRISIIFVTFNLTFRHCHSNAKYNLHR